MAKTKISEFSATPVNNTDIDGINIAEGCAPSGINDAIRELMAQLKDFQTGAAGDSFNGPVGTTTAAAGAFTTLSASSTATLNTLASSGATLTGGSINNMAIGGTTAAAASVTTLTTSSTVTHNGGTANGVAYLNGSKVLTSGSALTFDGTIFAVNGLYGSMVLNGSTSGYSGNITFKRSGTTYGYIGLNDNSGNLSINSGQTGQSGYFITFGAGDGSEQARLTSTGLAIGVSSPVTKLHVVDANNTFSAVFNGAGGTNIVAIGTTSLGASVSGYTAGFGATADLVLQPNGGNLGLGVTPSASNLPTIESQYGLFVGQGQTNIVANGYYSSGYLYKSTAAASRYQQISGQHLWYTAPSGTAGNGISFNQSMTLDASGNLGVGTTTTSPYRLNVLRSDGKAAFMTDGATADFAITCISGVSMVAAASTGVLALGTSGTERARIDSSGNLLVGCTDTLGYNPGARLTPTSLLVTNNSGSYLAYLNRQSNDGIAIQFARNNSGVGDISVTTTATSYNTSSDYRLKENIQPMTGALAKVAALKPVTYTWKADGSDGEGFIAHELAEVVPQCVTGEKDAVDADGKPVYQGIDTSFLVATLTAALQEAVAEINQLKARLDAANL